MSTEASTSSSVSQKSIADHFGKAAAKPKKDKPAKKASPAKKAKKKDENGEEAADADDPYNVFEDIEKATDHGKKRLSIERIYQKKSQLEHVLLRPDTYIGSVEPDRQTMWVYEMEKDEMVNREITFVPGLYKIFDEILVNAADNKQRDKNMNCIKVNIDADKNEISIWNNGKGIPVVHHAVEQMYVPELIFGTLLTSSNYDDSQRKVTGGRNGFGAKLCNIFSKKFTVETSCKEYKKKFKQTWINNMQKSGDAIVDKADGDDYTKITFRPDLEKFKMEKIDEDMVALMHRRAYDIAGSNKGVKVFLNGKKLPVTGFKGYVEQYVKNRLDDNNEPLKIVHEEANARWEIAATVSDKGFQQVSFVNSIATTKGGRHVDYVADQIVAKVIDSVKKKSGKSGVNIKPFQIKNHMWLFVNCLIENPTFDSQTKETMTLQSKNFGSKCELSEKFVNQTLKCGIVESVLAWVRFKQQSQLDQKCSSRKTSKINVPKCDDANWAGGKQSLECTLILTEGDSAKSLATAGVSVLGRDKFGVFPLKGKVLNVREATHKQIMENAEISSMIKILGLQYKKKYETTEDMKTLRYGKVMVMADQDQDGSHIKGLVINFIHFNWPSLMKHNFVEQFITPILKATKGKEELSFFSLPEYEEWKGETANWQAWKIKYYKGLGTSTAKEAKEYFSDMNRHRIKFRYSGDEDDKAIELAFSKKMIEGRKDWLTDWMKERRERRELNLAEDYLYNKDTKYVSFNEFIKKELVLFSNMDNERSIPSLVDGLKPGQRKVLFTCLKRNDKREVKVAQLAGSVAEMSAYHHGEASLMSTIINMAQDFIGSNNINLLMPNGQFGTRLMGGKDAASPRYIFTQLSPVTRTLFPAADDAVLRYLVDDNKRIEPEYYVPIIPMVLVNGAEGIGTGWSTKVPNYDPREIVANMKLLIETAGDQCNPMRPFYKNFKGEIHSIDGDTSRYVCYGEISVVDETTVEITDLPVKVWTNNYKESVLDPMTEGMNKNEKVASIVQTYNEYHADTTVRFVVTINERKLDELERSTALHSTFKLSSTINLTSMVLFDADGVLRKFDRVEDIMKEFFHVRRKTYVARKAYVEGLLQAQADRLTNQARFILEKIDGTIKMENKKKKNIVEQLVKGGYDPDPVKKWNEERKKREAIEDAEEEVDEEGEEGAEVVNSDDVKLSEYDYLVTMTLIKLSEEEKDKLLKERDNKQHELQVLKGKTWSDLWVEDLDAFILALDKQQQKEREDEKAGVNKVAAGKGGGKGGKQKKLAVARKEYAPTPQGRRIVPKIDPAMKLKLEKAEKAKENVGARSKKVKTEAEDDLENSALFDRLAKQSPTFAAKQKEAKKAAGPKFFSTSAKAAKKLDMDDDDEDGTSTKSAPKRKAAKGGGGGKSKRKRNEWSESEESELSDKYSEFSDEDEEQDYVPVKKDRTKQPAAKKVVDSDEDVDEVVDLVEEPAHVDEEPMEVENDIVELSDTNEEEVEKEVEKEVTKPAPPKKEKKKAEKPAAKKAAKKPAQEKKKNTVASDSDDDEAPKVSKKKPAASKKIDSDDDEFAPAEDKDDSPPPQARARPGRAAAAQAVKKYKFDDDESDVSGDGDDSYKSGSD